MEHIYKFKYEKNGKIYASKDTLPSEDDVFLIDRDVLEGKKEPVKPAPAPVPHGEKKITKNGKYDVSKFASADVEVPTGVTPSGQLEIVENGIYDVATKASVKVEVPTAEPAPEHKVDNEASIAALKEAIEAAGAGSQAEGEFEFDHCDVSLFKEMWESMDPDAVDRLTGRDWETWEPKEPRFSMRHEGAISVPVNAAFEVGDNDGIIMDVQSPVANWRANVEVDTDTEAGATRVVANFDGPDGAEFTGKVIVKYPVEE